MIMRFFQIRIKPDALLAYRKFYDEKVIPEFQKMEGCLYASLIQSSHHKDECISMTLWQSPDHAQAYEKSDIYQKLLEAERKYLADSSEWKVELSKEMKLEYKPIPEEPTIKAYSVEGQTDAKGTVQEIRPMHLRIVSVKIQPGKIDEFRRLYSEEILPTLRTVKGCRYAYLTESEKEKDEFISVTLWDSKQDAENYEQGGIYQQLLEKAKHTFSDLYQWKMGLQKQTGGKAATSEDLTVDHYNIVTGRSFK